MGIRTLPRSYVTETIPAMRALIVEDDLLTGLELQACLAYFGFDVCGIARTQHEAIDLGLRQRPDLIAADILLPDGSGIDAVSRIRSKAAIPTIFVTGVGSDVRSRIPDAVVVEKPFTETALRRALIQAMPAAPETWRRSWSKQQPY